MVTAKYTVAILFDKLVYCTISFGKIFAVNFVMSNKSSTSDKVDHR